MDNFLIFVVGLSLRTSRKTCELSVSTSIEPILECLFLILPMSKRAIAYRLTVFHCHREEVCVRATRVYINAECISKKLMVASVLECPRRLFQRNLSERNICDWEFEKRSLSTYLYYVILYLIDSATRKYLCFLSYTIWETFTTMRMSVLVRLDCMTK